MPIYEEECRACGEAMEYYSREFTERTRPCRYCGHGTERIVSLSVPQIFQSFRTSNIMKDGSEVEIKSARQLSQLCRENGVIPAQDKDNTA